MHLFALGLGVRLALHERQCGTQLANGQCQQAQALHGGVEGRVQCRVRLARGRVTLEQHIVAVEQVTQLRLVRRRRSGVLLLVVFAARRILVE